MKSKSLRKFRKKYIYHFCKNGDVCVKPRRGGYVRSFTHIHEAVGFCMGKLNWMFKKDNIRMWNKTLKS